MGGVPRWVVPASTLIYDMGDDPVVVVLGRDHDAVPYPTQTSPHYTDCTFLSGGCCNCRPQTSPDGEASTPHATASHRSLTSVAPAGEDYGAPEPPAGTPVWWEGDWWYRSDDGDDIYCDTITESPGQGWSDMPGAVPALTPEQHDARFESAYAKGSRAGYRSGRNDAARDVDTELAKHAESITVYVRDRAVRAARGEERGE